MYQTFGEEQYHNPNRKENLQNQSIFYSFQSFYIGLFKYGGEIHEGKHEPIVSKKLFDEAQEMLKSVDNPNETTK